MFEYPEELAKVPEDVVWSMLLTNIAAVTMMTRLMVNDMKQRQKGIIVNVSSGTALQPAPLASVYAASKVCLPNFFLQTELFLFSLYLNNREMMIMIRVCLRYIFQVYVKSFTMALNGECQPYGIDVQLLSPYFVQTKLNSYSTSVMAGNLFVPDVESYGRSAIFTLGKTNETTGYWSHAVQVRQ